MKDILDVNILEDLNDIINFSNIKLLEKPEIKENTTILKIICNKNLKCSLKKIEKLLNNSLKFIINFNLDSEKDYYELIINKKINKIVNHLNINNSYNIGVKLLIDNKLWMLESIEISDDNEYEDEDIVDYCEIFDDLLLKTNIKINSTNLNLNKYNKLKNILENNFKINEIENYYKLIN
jgi:hypothetical protein